MMIGERENLKFSMESRITQVKNSSKIQMGPKMECFFLGGVMLPTEVRNGKPAHLFSKIGGME
jgi:hypothetical protein